jgi:serine/threonine protein kinase
VTELAPPRPLPALIDGRYRPTRVLGQGSFARTLACLDLQEGERPVAVKHLRVQGVGDWKPVELFEREARVLATLRHQGVPEIYRHFEGQDDEGKLALYLVMELIEGPSLRDELRAGRSFDDLETTDLALALLEVLEYLHARRPPVFHRDIKPSNIVLRPSGAPVLVDFGGVGQGGRPVQGGSTVSGTFGYMPPEQLLGQVSPASDLYALGATLLHLLTGREPTEFSFDAGRLGLPAEIDVRPALRQTIDALLAPAPRDRPVTARAARRLLLGEGESRALAPLGESLPAPRMTRGEPRPQRIDMGGTPRDPRGPLADVYANLMDTFDGRQPPGGRGAWSVIGQSALYAMMSVLSLGLVPVVFGVARRGRRRSLGPLFRDGLATTGRILKVDSTSAEITYEYDVGGQRYRQRLTCATPPAQHWVAGDPVTVLYAPDDPQRSCVVYRWQPG